MKNKATPIFLRCMEECHAGSGSSISIVDLPIQREKHTGFPIFISSSLKGSLREHFENLADNENDALNNLYLFGFEKGAFEKLKTANAELVKNYIQDHAGALAITDARILLFPVRSFYGVWTYITCPAVLKNFSERLNDYCGIKFEIPDSENIIDKTTIDSIFLQPEKENGKDIAIFEEYRMKFDKETDTKITNLFKNLENLTGISGISKRLVVIDNDVFTYFSTRHTPVEARNILNDEGISVNLFYEEMLNCETVLYSFVMPGNSFIDKKIDGGSVKYFTDIISKQKHFQLGAGQTTGKGIVQVSFSSKVTNQ